MAENLPRKRGRKPKKPGDPKSPYTPSIKTMERDGIKPFDGEEREYNSRLIRHSLETMQLAPKLGHVNRRVEDLPILQDCLLKYIELCDKNGIKPGVMGACAAMGVDYSLIYRWRGGGMGEEFKTFAEVVLRLMAEIREGLISDGKLHPVIGIFWQRNFDGLRNDTEQVQNAQQADDRGGYETVSEIKKRYGELLKE